MRALVVIGVLMVSRFSQPAADATPEAGSAKNRRRSLLAAVGGAIGFGVLIPAIDQLTPAAGRLGAIPLVFLLDLAIGVPLALAAKIDLSFPPRKAWVAIAAAGLFETVGFVWISLGASRAPVAIVSPLAGLASAFTLLFAWVVLRERPARLALAGAVAPAPAWSRWPVGRRGDRLAVPVRSAASHSEALTRRLRRRPLPLRGRGEPETNGFTLRLRVRA